MSEDEVARLETKLDDVTPLYRCVAGILNRVPSLWGKVVIKTAIAFGFLGADDEMREGPYAGNGEDSLVRSNTDDCCDVVVIRLWVNGEPWPDAIVFRAEEGKCLTRAVSTLAPKRSVNASVLKTTRVVDLLELEQA